MMNNEKKYELLEDDFIVLDDGTKLYRIRSLKAFGNVKAGNLGGYVEKESNLSHEGNCWVGDDAIVYGNARVYGDAIVYGNARVFGKAYIYRNARVFGNAAVYGNARVCGDAKVFGNAIVCGDAKVSANAYVCSDFDYTTIKGFGSKARNTTFYKTKDNTIRVVCGCFNGTLEEFRSKVLETHKDTKFAKEYLMIADLMEYHFKEE